MRHLNTLFAILATLAVSSIVTASPIPVPAHDSLNHPEHNARDRLAPPMVGVETDLSGRDVSFGRDSNVNAERDDANSTDVLEIAEPLDERTLVEDEEFSEVEEVDGLPDAVDLDLRSISMDDRDVEDVTDLSDLEVIKEVDYDYDHDHTINEERSVNDQGDGDGDDDNDNGDNDDNNDLDDGVIETVHERSDGVETVTELPIVEDIEVDPEFQSFEEDIEEEDIDQNQPQQERDLVEDTDILVTAEDEPIIERDIEQVTDFPAESDLLVPEAGEEEDVSTPHQARRAHQKRKKAQTYTLTGSATAHEKAQTFTWTDAVPYTRTIQGKPTTMTSMVAKTRTVHF